MKNITIEISETKITETKQEFDTRWGNWVKEIRLHDYSEKTLEQISAESGLSIDDILRCESGIDVPLYEATKLLEYYDPNHCNCMIARN